MMELFYFKDGDFASVVLIRTVSYPQGSVFIVGCGGEAGIAG